MSSFRCEQCGTDCFDTKYGFTSGCEHYPADLPRLTDEQCDDIFRAINDSNRYAILRATFAFGYIEGSKQVLDIDKNSHV